MALSGDKVVVRMDDAGGTLRTFDDGDISSVDVGLTYDQHDVTGFGDSVHNVINGQQQAPVMLKGYLTTTANTGTHTVIQGAFAAGAQVSLEVQVPVGSSPAGGDPLYKGEFYVESYKPTIQSGGAVTFEAALKPAVGSGATVPQWSTAP